MNGWINRQTEKQTDTKTDGRLDAWKIEIANEWDLDLSSPSQWQLLAKIKCHIILRWLVEVSQN